MRRSRVRVLRPVPRRSSSSAGAGPALGPHSVCDHAVKFCNIAEQLCTYLGVFLFFLFYEPLWGWRCARGGRGFGLLEDVTGGSKRASQCLVLVHVSRSAPALPGGSWLVTRELCAASPHRALVPSPGACPLTRRPSPCQGLIPSPGARPLTGRLSPGQPVPGSRMGSEAAVFLTIPKIRVVFKLLSSWPKCRCSVQRVNRMRCQVASC